jgi:hypothetical protein
VAGEEGRPRVIYQQTDGNGNNLTKTTMYGTNTQDPHVGARSHLRHDLNKEDSTDAIKQRVLTVYRSVI